MIKPGYFGKTGGWTTAAWILTSATNSFYTSAQRSTCCSSETASPSSGISPPSIRCEKCIVNRAIGGDDLHHLLRRFDADCIQLAPARCVLMIGTNDISRTHYDHWWRTEGEPQQLVLEEYKANLRGQLLYGNAKPRALPFRFAR